MSLRSLSLILLLVALPLPSYAQSDVLVPTISVMGSAKDKSAVTPTSELGGARLKRKKQTTVGETLAREGGVASTQFGPNSSRPISRGQEGERTRVLQNGTGVLDASTASEDHAVATDPLTIERVELVRGPGALVYSPNVVGGVVNLITNRIPEVQGEKLSSVVELKGATNEQLRSAGAVLNVPMGNSWALHLDGAARATEDYRGPDNTKVANSHNRTGSGAIGLSYVFDRGFVGGSFSNYESTYGTVAEEFVHINLLQQRFDTSAEIRDWAGFESVKLKNSYSNYKHDEIEEGSRATTFENEGNETRIDFKHPTFWNLNGLFGLESRTFDFSAEGEERFLPSTGNQLHAFYLHEEWAGEVLKPSLALRFENVEVKSKDDDAPFVKETRRFNPSSLALDLTYQMQPAYSVAITGAYTERAPNYQELFANGPHVVMESFERGDADLKKERSQSAELAFKGKTDDSSFGINAFLQDVQDYVILAPTGTVDGGSGFEISDYQGIEARLLGAELDWRRMVSANFLGGVWEAELKVDLLKGQNRKTGDNLPRITPIRETLGLLYKSERFEADLEVQRSERQRNLAPNESKTSDFTLVNLGVEVPVRGWGTTLNVVGRVQNIFDVEARNHVSRLKDIAPLPGRNFTLGLQAAF